MIALYPICLSSLATGPKILFPIGLISHLASLLIRITALSPNLTYVPSFLEISFLILTIKAWEIVPFLMVLVGKASFIAIMTLSPTVAVFALDHFKILNICHFFAQVSSAMMTFDSFFNMRDFVVI